MKQIGKSNRAASQRHSTTRIVTAGDVRVTRKNGVATVTISGATQARIETLCRIAGVDVEATCKEAIENHLFILGDDARQAAAAALGEV